MKRLRRTGDELEAYEGTNTWLEMEIALNWTMGLIPDKLYGIKVWERKAGTLTADGGYSNGGYVDQRTNTYHSDISPNFDDGHSEGGYSMGGWYSNEEFGYNNDDDAYLGYGHEDSSVNWIDGY